VAFAYNDQHFEVDHGKAKELEDDTSTHFSGKCTWDHRELKCITFGKIYFFFSHDFSLNIILG
jgi:hypothetical protein